MRHSVVETDCTLAGWPEWYSAGMLFLPVRGLLLLDKGLIVYVTFVHAVTRDRRLTSLSTLAVPTHA